MQSTAGLFLLFSCFSMSFFSEIALWVLGWGLRFFSGLKLRFLFVKIFFFEGCFYWSWCLGVFAYVLWGLLRGVCSVDLSLFSFPPNKSILGMNLSIKVYFLFSIEVFKNSRKSSSQLILSFSFTVSILEIIFLENELKSFGIFKGRLLMFLRRSDSETPIQGNVPVSIS